jgi:hypothetical protein
LLKIVGNTFFKIQQHFFAVVPKTDKIYICVGIPVGDPDKFYPLKLCGYVGCGHGDRHFGGEFQDGCIVSAEVSGFQLKAALAGKRSERFYGLES